MSRATPAPFWVGMVLATIVPLGIHSFMLDNLGVPYPSDFPAGGWPNVPDRILMLLGMIYLARHLPLGIPRRSWLLRMLAVFVPVAMLNETLLRSPIMTNMVSTRWTLYPFIDNLPAVLGMVLLASAVVAVAPLLSRWWTAAAGAVGMAVLYPYATHPIDHVFAGIIKADQMREGDMLYTAPYDWHVNLPAYLTYVEPVLGASAVAALLLHLPLERARLTMVIAAAIFALHGGPLFAPLLNPLYAPGPAWLGILSYAQFTFEVIALAGMVATIWTGRSSATSFNLGERR